MSAADGYGVTTAPPPRARSRGRGVLRAVGVLLVLVLLGVGLVVADRVALGVTEERTAERIQADLGADVTPSVEIIATPFLTQALSGELDELRLGSGPTTLTTPTGELAVERLEVVVQGLRSQDRFTTSTASTLRGSADVAYPEISRLAGQTITPGEQTADGVRWVIARDTQVLGLDVPVRVSGVPQLQGSFGRQIQLSQVELDVAGFELPQAVTGAVLETVLQPTPIDLPLDLRGETLVSTEDGMTLGFSGTDVAFS